MHVLVRNSGLSLVAAAGLLQAGCLSCIEPGCGGGFEWNAAPADGEAVPAGHYRFEITLEGDAFVVECDIAETYGESDCGEPQGDADWNLSLSFGQVNDQNWNPDDPVSDFHLRASDTSGSDPDGSYNETRGPTSVSIAVTRDDAALADVDYTLMYERDEDFYGDERCGFCESRVVRDETF